MSRSIIDMLADAFAAKEILEAQTSDLPMTATQALNLDIRFAAARRYAEVLVRAVANTLAGDEAIIAMCMAHDGEECAQKGEPNPWDSWLVEQYIAENGQAAWAEWRQERISAMRAALKTVGLA